MIGFEVSVNGQRLCVSGVGDEGVLTALVTWVSRASAGEDQRPEELFLQVGGLSGDTHLSWPSPPLQVGDCVQVRVLETSRPDEPTDRTSADRAFVEAQRRKHYERLKAEYEG
jgi:hypothetical protein